LNNRGRAFGVRSISAQAGAQNFKYSLTEIAKANSEVILSVLAEANLGGIINIVARPLKQGLLARLRNG